MKTTINFQYPVKIKMCKNHVKVTGSILHKTNTSFAPKNTRFEVTTSDDTTWGFGKKEIRNILNK